MKDNRFDDIVRSKLSDLKSDSKPKWNQFLEKKKAADIVEADMYFDKNIRNSISKYRVAYNANHWTLLKARMNHLASIKKKINGLKSLELAVLFLILFVSFSKFSHNPIATTSEPMVDLNLDAKSISSNNINQTSLSNNNNVIANNSNIETANSKTNKRLITEKPVSKTPVFVSNVASQNISKTTAENIQLNNGLSFISDDNTVNEISRLNKKSLTLSPLSQNNNSNLLADNYDEGRSFIETAANIKSADLISIHTERQLPLVSIDFGIKPLELTSSWLHIMLSFDNNMIHTPDDLVYNTTARKTEMFGFTFGVLYSKLIGRWELETGLTTSTYSKPWDFTQRFGNSDGWFEFTLTNINNNFVGVPIQAKYHFIQNQDWSIFGKTGLTSEFIVNSEYTSGSKYLGGGPFVIGTTPDVENVVSPFEGDHNFSKGIFQGGRVSDNLFIRAQLGLGIERNISNAMSVYFSGDYHMSLLNKDLGPNNDKINKFGFNVGLKMFIK